MKHLRITLLSVFVLLSVTSKGQAVTYIANVGVMVEIDEKKVLIDALFGQDNLKFDAPTPDQITEMVQGQAPYNKVDMVLFTHAHDDHFDPLITLDYLKANPTTKMIAPGQALDSMKAFGDVNDDISNRVLTYPWTKGWRVFTDGPITVKSAYAIHGGKINFKVQNLIHIVQVGKKKVLHLGDTQMELSQIQNLRLNYEDIDVAIVPFWYLSSLYGGELLRNYVNAKKYVGVHLPVDGVESSLAKINEKFPEAIIFNSKGQQVQF